jgi:hypothetical protein
MWTARSGQMVANILATEVTRMLKTSYLLHYTAQFFACVILKAKDKTATVCSTQRCVVSKRVVNIWQAQQTTQNLYPLIAKQGLKELLMCKRQ